MVLSLKQKAFGRRSFPDLLKLGSNIISRVIDLYILNRLKRTQIHNDPGASFTTITRVGKRIRKRAQPDGEEKLRHEIEWMVRFRKTAFKSFLPKLYDYSTKPGDVSYTMKYYDFANLRAVIALDMNADYFLRKRWRYLFDQLLRFLWTTKNSVETKPDFFEKTHLNKYHRRMRQAREMAPFIQSVLNRNSVLINEKEYLTPDVLMEYISGSESVRRALTPQRVYITHGDIHTNNILCGIKAKRMILLDCRGKAPDGSDYFDVAYDIAKVYHDLRSLYSLIERHHYTVFLTDTEDTLSIEFKFNQKDLVDRFHNNHRWVEAIIDEFADQFGNLRYRADFTEAMLYLTMVPLHLKERSEGLVCLLTGVIRLNEWFHRYHPESFTQLARDHMSAHGLTKWEAL